MGAADQGATAHLGDRRRGLQYVAQIAMRKPCVLAHQRFGTRALAVFNGSDDFAMLVLRQRQNQLCFGAGGLRHDQAIGRGER
ncbi:hypothetical protein N8D55_02890 [Xanthomonas hortorum pv. pelargonii]|nr:hypothetical protein N8D55_02890 [Xanthomonas hortorum pv. pelargonii]